MMLFLMFLWQYLYFETRFSLIVQYSSNPFLPPFYKFAFRMRPELSLPARALVGCCRRRVTRFWTRRRESILNKNTNYFVDDRVCSQSNGFMVIGRVQIRDNFNTVKTTSLRHRCCHILTLDWNNLWLSICKLQGLFYSHLTVRVNMKTRSSTE